ncbi:MULTISPECIES: hypothetical protein [unclassified Rhizobacter]|uniref:hypothetical protein n=1 Tax=unclassified Rhizobacter TaxID=2640088 RepID=UPI0006F79474|nr:MULTISPECIES: hypothetical protein [unclassified Rhizobacter]KQU76780.1 hypothetical protein ASC88_02290 [Rhizobacter sp. Root29]KQV97300.1 hypothetical protein ASC98_11820 [Rhizobacter sp. Root1238]KRB09972.1 hypothetical protein ASE08_10455 [Rhizobacter sp. Root16D2]
MKLTILIGSMMLAASAGAFAQSTTAGSVQRDVNQQERIEQGLKSGQLTTQEAGKLEREESHVDKLQAQSLKDGKLTPAEKARLEAAQNKASRDIAAAKHNGVTGNPNSASSQRMQADVQRNVNQEKRVEAGVQNGSLTNHEAAKLERGQAHVDRKEAAAARDGHVGAAEERGIQRSENRQSRKIHRQKTDAQVRKG